MGRYELRVMGERLLAEARALRAAFPDAAAMWRVPATGGEAGSAGGGEAAADFRAAVGYLRAEMALVRDGKADSLTVLDDEIANVERLLPRP
jgi:hypothetical protein